MWLRDPHAQILVRKKLWATVDPDSGTSHQNLEIGYRNLESVYRNLEIGYRNLEIGYRNLEIGYRNLVGRHRNESVPSSETGIITPDFGRSSRNLAKPISLLFSPGF